MHRLRTTFTRSRTPTGAEMKTQSSLEVPKQVRSASFDEIQLEAQRAAQLFRYHQTSSTDEQSTSSLLQVPQVTSQRSRSFDSAGSDESGTFLEVPRRFQRRKSNTKTPPPCIHCQYVEEYNRMLSLQYQDDLLLHQQPYNPNFFIKYDNEAPPGMRRSFSSYTDYSSSASTSSTVSSDSSGGEDEGDDGDTTTTTESNTLDDEEDEKQHQQREDDIEYIIKSRKSLLQPPVSPMASPCEITFMLVDLPELATGAAAIELSTSPLLPSILSPVYHGSPLSSPTIELPPGGFDDTPPPQRARRRSISRQEAIIEPTGNSLENVNMQCKEPLIHSNSSSSSTSGPGSGATGGGGGSTGAVDSSSSSYTTATAISSCKPFDSNINNNNNNNFINNMSNNNSCNSYNLINANNNSSTINTANNNNLDIVVRDIYLAVPDLKRDRAASVDSCFSKVSSAGKTEELQPPEGDLTLLVVPSTNATRSRSVDIVLPTEEQARYKALALAGPNSSANCGGGNNGMGGGVITGDGIHILNSHRKSSTDNQSGQQIRCTPDWGENAVSGDHLWVPISVSGDPCYVDGDCLRHGPRLKCSACKAVTHNGCLGKLQLKCKPTFRDGVRQYREETKTIHHWVHKRTDKGKCHKCGKSLQAKLSFSSKDIVAISCSWCKNSYHNKQTCYEKCLMDEECSLGLHSKIIVPPAWIVKLPRKGSFKSSLRKTPKKKTSSKRKPKEKEPRTFIIKPIPTNPITPVLVFINPKSGGNQGAKLLQKFQWLLNPRQVFDLTQGGPKMGLELFRKVPQLRVLACGGDGTVGWVLSVLDQLKFQTIPAVGVLPLGTGNDLARALGWGGGYTDEPIGKILANIGNSDTVLLDRWQLVVEPNAAAGPADPGKDSLPLNVVNNYYSLGVDAHIALEFHEAREAHPEKFNSRLRNKMFYGQAGGKDLLKRKWKGLAEFVTLECDGKDLTPKLKELKVHAIVFLNIPSYGGGTHPWNKSGGQYEPSTEDGLIEVVGLTTYQLPLLQAGGHGTCIAQCKSAKIVTSKTIPMQVDGEACKLKPSTIEIKLLNQALMLAKKKPGRANVQQATSEPVQVQIHRISMSDYEKNHYDKELLKQSAIQLGSLDVNLVTDLEQIRSMINKLSEDAFDSPKLSPDWCFIDSCTAERFFRVDRAQENLHYVNDITMDIIYILDQECATLPQTPEDETALASPSSMHQPHPISSSIESSDKDSREGTPSSPSKKFFNRSLSGPGSGSGGCTSGSLSPGIDIPSRKSSQGSQGSHGSHGSHGSSKNLDVVGSNRENGQSLDSVVNYRSNLLEKTTDGVIKAAKTGDLAMLKELKDQGYSLLSIDSTGQTALHHSCHSGHEEIVRFLITCAPGLINMIDNDKGQTALHKAVARNRRSISQRLVAGGALLTIQDNDGKTAKMLAIEVDDTELSLYLETQEQFQLLEYSGNV